MTLASGLVDGTGFLTVRVGTATATIEAVGLGSAAGGGQVLSDQLKAVAVKQVEKLRAAQNG
jgi:hypothetical protein